MQHAPTAEDTDARPHRGWDRYDALIAAGLAIATFFAHPVQRMLSHPYWLDEAWVAVLTRASWARVVRIGSPTPIGFLALLKLVPGSGLQRARLVALAFSMLTVAMAYVLTRSLSWRSRSNARLAAAATALVVMLAPLSLQRNDLKQYSCDAFCALTLLALGTRAERGRVPTWWVGVAAVATLPFSSTAAFVAVAVFAGLLGSALIARDRKRTLVVLEVGGVTAALVLAYFGLVVLPKLSSGLHSFWAGYYLNGSPLHMLHVSWNNLTRLRTALGMPVLVFGGLFTAGIVVLARMRMHALAIAVPLLWVEMFAVARLHRYPFLDLRTSQFLLVSSLVVVALGAMGLVELGVRFHRTAGVVIGVGLALMFAAGSVKFIHKLGIANEDVRTPTQVLARLYQPRDVVVVNNLGSDGFAYYWPHGQIVLHPDSTGAGFHVSLAGVNGVFARDRRYPEILAAVREAVKEWKGSGPGSHLFVVRSHLSHAEQLAWRQAFSSLRVKTRIVYFAREPLLEIRTAAAEPVANAPRARP